MSFCIVGDWAAVDSRVRRFRDMLAVGNLECAFADGDVSNGKAYTSVLKTFCLDHLTVAGFDAMSIANNHVYDAGGKCFDSLVAELERRNIRYFGTREKPFAELKVGTKKVAVIGSLEPCRSRGPRIFRQEDVLSLVKCIRNDFDKVYVYPHWGKEGEYTRWPSPKQRNLARRWIDAGADGVFGSHSHVFQGREYYKGKPIYYSLGNYYFPHPESKLYEGTDVGLCVEVCDDGVKVVEHFVKDGKAITEDTESGELRAKLDAISEPLKDWTTWKWAKAIGPFNLKKNTSSWKIRLRKNFGWTLPKFLVWQVLPKTLLFRVAGYFD